MFDDDAELAIECQGWAIYQAFSGRIMSISYLKKWRRREERLTSLVQTLKVSISLAAQTEADIDPDCPCIQPVCATLHPQLLTRITASSSSSSSAFDVLTSPSVDPDRIIFWFVSFLVGAYDKVVISSEWVDPWVRKGVAGCRGSLIKKVF